MSVGWGGGNQGLLFALGNQALQTVDHLDTYFTVQRRHPDGQRWLDLAHFASQEDAEAAMRSVIAAGHAETDELRVHKVTRDADDRPISGRAPDLFFRQAPKGTRD